MVGTPLRPYLCLIICSFNFPSFRHHTRFSLCLFFLPLVSHLRFYQSSFILSFGLSWLARPLDPIKALLFVPLISHRLDTILVAVYVYSSSILFHIIGTPSRFYLRSFISSTRFSTLGSRSRFYLSSFLFSICD